MDIQGKKKGSAPLLGRQGGGEPSMCLVGRGPLVVLCEVRSCFWCLSSVRGGSLFCLSRLFLCARPLYPTQHKHHSTPNIYASPTPIFQTRITHSDHITLSLPPTPPPPTAHSLLLPHLQQPQHPSQLRLHLQPPCIQLGLLRLLCLRFLRLVVGLEVRATAAAADHRPGRGGGGADQGEAHGQGPAVEGADQPALYHRRPLLLLLLLRRLDGRGRRGAHAPLLLGGRRGLPPQKPHRTGPTRTAGGACAWAAAQPLRCRGPS